MTISASPVSWRDMDRRSRAVWFNDHGDRFAQARGKFAEAAEVFARECVECGALENNTLSAEQVLNDIMDTADGVLAEEVQRWVGV